MSLSMQEYNGYLDLTGEGKPADCDSDSDSDSDI